MDFTASFAMLFLPSFFSSLQFLLSSLFPLISAYLTSFEDVAPYSGDIDGDATMYCNHTVIIQPTIVEKTTELVVQDNFNSVSRSNTIYKNLSNTFRFMKGSGSITWGVFC